MSLLEPKPSSPNSRVTNVEHVPLCCIRRLEHMTWLVELQRWLENTVDR